MKYVDCYICKSSMFKTVVIQNFDDPYLNLINPKLNHQKRSISVCVKCGFTMHQPQLTGEEIDILYKKFRDSEFRKEQPDDYFDRITSLPKEKSFNYQKIKSINKAFRKHFKENLNGKKRAIYDIGCGGGVFLKTFLDYADGDWQAWGVEPTTTYAELSARRLGIEVANTLYEPKIFKRKFDFITIIKVLEHAPNPIQFLNDVKQDLDDDGIVYIEVPHVKEIRSLPFDHDQLTYTHLYFYSKPTFEYICMAAGYETVYIEEKVNPEGDVDLISVLKTSTHSKFVHDNTFPIQDFNEILALAQPKGR